VVSKSKFAIIPDDFGVLGFRVCTDLIVFAPPKDFVLC
jgi:hypothetical protein